MKKGERENVRDWQALPNIYVRLHKDELGYPPKEWEQLKGEPTDRPSVFRVMSIPFYVRGLALKDEVFVQKSVEGYFPVFSSVAQRSGYSTIRLMIEEHESRENLISYFTERDALLEFQGRLVALAIPASNFDELSSYVAAEKSKGRWDSEDGFLTIDDPPVS